MKWSCPDLLSLYPEDAKGTGWEKVGLSAVRRNGQHGSAANGSGRPLIGRRAQPHSRMKLRVQWKGVLPKTTNQLDLQGEHGMSDIKFSKLKIEGWRQFRSIEIDLHPQLTIITGANGAGKSTILGFFTRHFGYNRNYLATPKRNSGVTSFVYGLFDVLRYSSWFKRSEEQHPQIGEISYTNGVSSAIRLPPSKSLDYNLQIEQQQKVNGIHIDSHRPPNIYRHVSQFPATPPTRSEIGSALNNEYMSYYASGNVQSGSLHHIKMALIQMSIFGHGNSTMEPMPELIDLFSGFEEKLRLLLPPSLGFNKIVIRSPEVLLSTRSGDFLIDAASGGVIKLFEIAWQLFFHSQGSDSFVATFDEPENHLHPSMQKAFLPSVLKAFPEMQIIVVTHSPFIISALRESSVYVLRYSETDYQELDSGMDSDESIKGMMGTRVTAEKLDTVNKAGTASEILREVLGITSTIPDWAEDRVHAITQEFRERLIDDAMLKELYAKLEGEGLASSYPTVIATVSSSK